MVVKIALKSKSVDSNRKKRAAHIYADLYFKYQIVNNKVKIIGGQWFFCHGTEINQHQQDTLSDSKNIRKNFAQQFGISLTEKSPTKIIMKSEQLNWLNTKINELGSILNVSKVITGNNPTGSQKKKKQSEFKLYDGKYVNKPFYNLLRVFTEDGKLKFSDFNINKHITFDEFVDQVSQINEDNKYVIENFFSEEYDYFYIDEMRAILGIDDSSNVEAKLRREFRIKLISKYERRDQLYKIFKARKMVEAAHIKPVSHIKKETHEISDIDNGLLLSPDIHKLFDAGYITFSNTGDVIFTTREEGTEYNISKKEVERLQLGAYRLDTRLLNPERLRYLEYHRIHVYHKGV